MAKKAASAKQLAARAKFKKRIAEAKKIFAKGGISWSNARKQAFKK